MYKVLTHTHRNSMSNSDAALHFAVMDINKRGGGAAVGRDRHIQEYCRHSIMQGRCFGEFEY